MKQLTHMYMAIEFCKLGPLFERGTATSNYKQNKK